MRSGNSNASGLAPRIFTPDDGKLYHASGEGNEIFEAIDLGDFGVEDIPLSGFGYVEALALLYTGAGNFLLFDKGESANAPDRVVINLTTAGVATDTGFTTDHKVKGAVFFNHSTLGAAVTINSDGSFSYDPTVSATLQALTLGQSMVDTFSYIVVDAYGPAGAVGTVSTTVAFDVDTVTTITSDDPDPSFLGESVALVATVVGESGIPTGNVTFKDGTTSLGTVALIAGTATLNTTATPLGTRSITAEYAGLGGFNPSASGAANRIPSSSRLS